MSSTPNRDRIRTFAKNKGRDVGAGCGKQDRSGLIPDPAAVHRASPFTIVLLKGEWGPGGNLPLAHAVGGRTSLVP